MVRRALPTLMVWIALVVVLDLPRVIALAGVVFAFVLGWLDRQKEIAARYEEPVGDDEPFERDTPIYYP